MKIAAVAWIGGFIFLALPCRAEAACRVPRVRDSMEVGPGELSLADLLPPGGCPELYQAAARVSLGAAPRAGSERVLDGREIRRRLEQLERDQGNAGSIRSLPAEFPERIVVRRAGAMKRCAEVADFLASAREAAGLLIGAGWQQGLNCSGAGNVPESAVLELTKTGWNPFLRRWEFALRCARGEQCVPFLVWTRGSNDDGAGLSANALEAAPQGEAAVKRGQMATLVWEEAGIRVVLPVRCLEAGRIGQSVLVRFENAARTLRAEVVGAGSLRASL